jgi:hypothetical protein
MIGESTLNEYKAYKNLVKHKKELIMCFQNLVPKLLFTLAVQVLTRRLQLLLWPAVQLHLLKLPEKILEKREEQHW